VNEATTGFEQETDVLVVGSGAGGLVAALTAAAQGLDVLVVEKAAEYGGSTSLSGGGAWAPNAPELVRAGERDDPEKVVDYLQAIAPGVSRVRHERYVAEIAEVMAFLEQSLHFRNGFFWARGYSDYHPNKGGSALGRGLWPSPIDKRSLGPDEAALRGGTARIPGAPRGLWLTSVDYHQLIALRWGGWRGRKMMLRLGARVLKARVTRERMAASGQALVTRLRLSLRDAGVPLLLQTPMRSLILDESGRVVGVETGGDGARRIRARRGVILASGGFEHNVSMREEYQSVVGKGWSVASPDNTGDGIRAGRDIGAAVELMDDAWWIPVLRLPVGVWPLVSERGFPGQFIVNGAGQRFTNEAGPYTDFVHDQLEGHAAGVSHIPVYMILDDRAWRRNIIAGHLPGRSTPQAWIDAGCVRIAQTFEELAAQIGVPAEALVETAARYNAFARNGKDEDFGRGDSAYDRYYGDSTYANPNLAEVSKPPFYAFELLPGDLGTKGGLLTDEHARVLREDGTVIDGLYATGNVSASVMGHDYAGPGATIGPAMTFGWVASRHIAGAVRGVAPGAGPS
jgi:3-oxosteroid 1-dehydrogenase